MSHIKGTLLYGIIQESYCPFLEMAIQRNLNSFLGEYILPLYVRYIACKCVVVGFRMSNSILLIFYYEKYIVQIDN